MLGARMVESWGDAQLQQAALSVLEKVEAALPESERPRVHNTALFSLAFHVPPEVRTRLGQLRHAIADQHHVSLRYRDRHGELTARTVRPLGLYFWGSTWTLGAYCELREDFRNFRLDRMEDSTVQSTTFELRPPITLADYVRSMAGE